MLVTIFTKLSFFAYCIAMLLAVLWVIAVGLTIIKKVSFSFSYKVLYWLLGFALMSTFFFSVISH
jgi:hypothetical protein